MKFNDKYEYANSKFLRIYPENLVPFHYRTILGDLSISEIRKFAGAENPASQSVRKMNRQSIPSPVQSENREPSEIRKPRSLWFSIFYIQYDFIPMSLKLMKLSATMSLNFVLFVSVFASS